MGKSGHGQRRASARRVEVVASVTMDDNLVSAQSVVEAAPASMGDNAVSANLVGYRTYRIGGVV